MDQVEVQRERFLALIRHWHADHPRKDQVCHCINTMRWLEQALDQEQIPKTARREMILAALGHDLYEDSKIHPAEITAEYGEEVNQLIEQLTRRTGVPEYVERVAAGPEAVRLIKLCDGIDNYGGLVENGLVWSDPVKWVTIVRLDMEPMFNRLEGIPFVQYMAAERFLKRLVAEKRERFWDAVNDLLRRVVAPKGVNHD